MITGLRRLGSATVVCILVSAALDAADTPKTKKNSQLVAVRGCLRGRVLTTNQEAGADDRRADRYRHRHSLQLAHVVHGRPDCLHHDSDALKA
jgi:hypothetical protein